MGLAAHDQGLDVVGLVGEDLVEIGDRATVLTLEPPQQDATLDQRPGSIGIALDDLLVVVGALLVVQGMNR